MTFTLPLKKRLLCLLFAFVIGYCMVGLVAALLIYKCGADSTPAMRIVAVLQDVLLFVLPAVATAVIVTRQPAELLEVHRRPAVAPLVWCAVALVASIPAMNMVIWLNESMPLPASLAEHLRAMEDNAAAAVEVLQGPHTVPNLIMSILVVGIFAALSEELLFRGALQRLMATGGVSIHASIWIAAACFSLMHMQFYGFVPRLLLGALFGYTLVWTRSLWAPVVLHALNNTIYLVAQWVSAGPDESPIDSVGRGQGWVYVALSVVLVAAALRVAWKNRAQIHQ